jgi:hypothetical protein
MPDGLYSHDWDARKAQSDEAVAAGRRQQTDRGMAGRRPRCGRCQHLHAECGRQARYQPQAGPALLRRRRPVRR